VDAERDQSKKKKILHRRFSLPKSVWQPVREKCVSSETTFSSGHASGQLQQANPASEGKKNYPREKLFPRGIRVGCQCAQTPLPWTLPFLDSGKKKKFSCDLGALLEQLKPAFEDIDNFPYFKLFFTCPNFDPRTK
jgi:hypothetical protein